MPKSFASKLKLARKKLELTQVALAEKLDVPKRTLIAWENSQTVPRPLTQEAVQARLAAMLKGAK